MMNFRIFLAALALTVGAMASGCGGETDSKAGSDDKDDQAASGQTECGQLTCQAGEYCSNGLCENGCLANTNCASDQTCVKEGSANIGACKNKTNAATGPTLEQFCAKGDTCSAGLTAAECKQLFDGTSAACHTCVVDSNCSANCDAECGQ